MRHMQRQTAPLFSPPTQIPPPFFGRPHAPLTRGARQLHAGPTNTPNGQKELAKLGSKGDGGVAISRFRWPRKIQIKFNNHQEMFPH